MITLGGVFSFLLAALKAWPPIKDLFDRFVAFYVERELAGMREENAKAVVGAIEKQDQRELERLLGYSRAGQASGVPGTEIRDRLPGVAP